MLTAEQVEARRAYIGASDAAAVLGLSRWRTPLQVWAEKTGMLPSEDISNRLPIEVGNELEDLVCKLFTKRSGKAVRRVNETIFHPKYPFLAVNVDRRVVGEDAVLEAKTASGWKAKEWEGEEIPQEYIVQCLHNLAVTGKARCYVAVLIGGNQDFQWKVIERDEAAISTIIEREVAFWNDFVIPKVLPVSRVKAGDSDTLYKLFPSAQGEDSPLLLGDEANRIIESMNALYRDLKTCEAAYEGQKNALKALLKENAVATTGTYKVTWKEQARAEHIVKASKTRVLRVTPIRKTESTED